MFINSKSLNTVLGIVQDLIIISDKQLKHFPRFFLEISNNVALLNINENVFFNVGINKLY